MNEGSSHLKIQGLVCRNVKAIWIFFFTFPKKFYYFIIRFFFFFKDYTLFYFYFFWGRTWGLRQWPKSPKGSAGSAGTDSQSSTELPLQCTKSFLLNVVKIMKVLYSYSKMIMAVCQNPFCSFIFFACSWYNTFTLTFTI